MNLHESQGQINMLKLSFENIKFHPFDFGLIFRAEQEPFGTPMTTTLEDEWNKARREIRIGGKVYEVFEDHMNLIVSMFDHCYTSI